MFHKIKWNKNLQKNVSMTIRLKLKRLFWGEKLLTEKTGQQGQGIIEGLPGNTDQHRV